MSAPVPTAGKQNDLSDGRRLSTGNMLDGAARMSNSPLVLDASITSVVNESVDEDFNRRMRNMSFVQETVPAPPVSRPNFTSYNNHMPSHAYAPYLHQQAIYSPMPPSYPQYPSQQAFYEPPRPGFQLETMHGMPGYPYQGPVPRSNQSSSPSNYSTTPHPPTTPRPYGWGSPPMSPALSTLPSFGGMGSMAGPGRGNHEGGMGNGMDEYGGNPGMVYGNPPPRSQWTTPTPASPYPHYTPFQQHLEPAVPPTASPMPALGFQQRGPWTGYQHRPAFQNNPNRMSWSAPTSNGNQRERERKAYHPQAPARRSDWVMWVGNVPSTTSHEELWRYFNSNAPNLPGDSEDVTWHGPSSIFLISRSSCAFVNLSCQEDLDRAVQYFNGKSLRPDDPKCPRMVCRIRRKDDDLKAGVGAQRGTGMHREWIKAQGGQEPNLPPAINTTLAPPLSSSTPGSARSGEPPSPAVLEHPPEGEGRRRESIVNANNAQHNSSASMASTNSSFLVRYFPKRFFIVKSLTTVELEDSVKSGTWKTQRHNEPVLDQAFRTAQEVILIFSANKSGEFFGYAKMIEPIDKAKASARAAQSQRPGRPGSHSSGSNGSTESGSIPQLQATPQNESITEEDETEPPPQRPHWLQTQSSQRFAASSPGQLTPQDIDSESDNIERVRRGERKTESPKPVGMGSLDKRNAGLSPSHLQRAHTLSPDAVPASHHAENQISSFFDIPVPQASREDEASKQEALGGSSRPADLDRNGVLRKDTVLTPGEKAERQEVVNAAEGPSPDTAFAPEEWGQPFRIEWIRAGNLPFHRIRNLRNPWNADREVKVSRDGTEIEPATAAMLLAEWDRMGYNNVLPTFPAYR